MPSLSPGCLPQSSISILRMASTRVKWCLACLMAAHSHRFPGLPKERHLGLALKSSFMKSRSS